MKYNLSENDGWRVRIDDYIYFFLFAVHLCLTLHLQNIQSANLNDHFFTKKKHFSLIFSVDGKPDCLSRSARSLDPNTVLHLLYKAHLLEHISRHTVYVPYRCRHLFPPLRVLNSINMCQLETFELKGSNPTWIEFFFRFLLLLFRLRF